MISVHLHVFQWTVPLSVPLQVGSTSVVSTDLYSVFCLHVFSWFAAHLIIKYVFLILAVHLWCLHYDLPFAVFSFVFPCMQLLSLMTARSANVVWQQSVTIVRHNKSIMNQGLVILITHLCRPARCWDTGGARGTSSSPTPQETQHDSFPEVRKVCLLLPSDSNESGTSVDRQTHKVRFILEAKDQTEGKSDLKRTPSQIWSLGPTIPTVFSKVLALRRIEWRSKQSKTHWCVWSQDCTEIHLSRGHLKQPPKNGFDLFCKTYQTV